jgi:hypothetical protein
MDWSGYFIMDVLAVVILGGALAYGTLAWRQRSRDAATRRASDEATRHLYHPEDDTGN